MTSKTEATFDALFLADFVQRYEAGMFDVAFNEVSTPMYNEALAQLAAHGCLALVGPNVTPVKQCVTCANSGVIGHDVPNSGGWTMLETCECRA